jgi:creatinine amidohydrolase
MAKEMWTYAMEEMSYPDVKEVLKSTDVALIPIGSHEKHGPHIPLATDSWVTIEVVRRAAKKAQVPFTPLMPFGYSPHHMGVVNDGVGSITLSGETLRRVVYEIGRSLIFHGFNKLIYISHHASNTKVIDEPLRRLRYETKCFCCWFMTPTERKIEVVKDIFEEKIAWHSGELETSTSLAYNEKAVHMDRAHKHTAHAPKWMGEAFDKYDGVPTVIFQGSESAWVPMEHHEYVEEATIGDPFLGSKEKGEKYFDRASSHLADFAREVQKIPIKVDPKARDYDVRSYR